MKVVAQKAFNMAASGVSTNPSFMLGTGSCYGTHEMIVGFCQVGRPLTQVIAK